MEEKPKRFKLINFFKSKLTDRHTPIDKSVADEMILSGTRQGNFFAPDQITVTADSHIYGTIVAAHAIVSGRVTGDITCSGELLIEATAVIEGNMVASTIDIRPGAVIRGTFKRFSGTDIREEPAAAAPEPAPNVLPHPDEEPVDIRQDHREPAEIQLTHHQPAEVQPTSWW